MAQKGRHKNTELRIANVLAIVNEHYEPGVQSKCYREVWRRYVYPVYPMCYRTLLTYLGTNREDNKQLKLFDD